MRLERIALWVLGPIGSGKSTLIGRTLPPQFRIVDQDSALERQASNRGLSLDCRAHDAAESAAFAALRAEVAEEVWSQVPRWRIEGVPIAFQPTGDKPHLLQRELDAGRTAGYGNLAIALRVPEGICLDHNRRRRRVVSDDVVVRTVNDFERNLRDGVYQNMFGPNALVIVTEPESFNISEWLEARARTRPRGCDRGL
jgi:predicted kinase